MGREGERGEDELVLKGVRRKESNTKKKGRRRERREERRERRKKVRMVSEWVSNETEVNRKACFRKIKRERE